jgi:integrase
MAKRTSDGFYKRGAIWWTRLHGERVSTGCKDLEAARLWRAGEERERVERATADPRVEAAKTATLGHVIQLFLAEAETAKLSEATRSFYSFKTAQLAHHLGKDLTLAELSVSDLNKYIAVRRSLKVSDATIAKELATLRGVLGLAIHVGLYHRDPKAVMPRKFTGTYKPRTRHMTRREVDLLLEALGRWPHRAAWVAFAVATGARLSEVNGARQGDVDFKRGVVRIRGTKTEKSAREIPVISITRELLEFAVKNGGGTEGAMFVPWATSNANQTLARACDRVKIPRVSPNDLRRTFASWLVQSGVATATVGHVMGHTTAAMVERTYGRQTVDTARELIERALRTHAAETRDGIVPDQPGTTPNDTK